MKLRKDAMLTAARIVEEVNRIAFAHQPAGRGTVGFMQVKPNSRNVVPGEVKLSVDLRHAEKPQLDAMEAEMRASCAKLAERGGVSIDIKCVTDYPPLKFDTDLVGGVRTSTQKLGYRHMDIVSGAGHDACYVARVAPTAMIFVPCEAGISHNEIENADPVHLEAGANVLMSAVMRAASPEHR
jgi:N-carbamoyl-L-amino-acid hydrolase